MSGRIPLSVTGELAKRIQAVSDELMALHSELYWIALADTKPPQFEELNIDLVTDFKFAVDNMRDLLWKYLEVAEKIEPQLVQEAEEAHRMRRVTQLLQLLRERLGHYPDTQPMSFIEKISASIGERLTGGGKAA
jgi:hypothetical protein